jgi:hypothetical protein
MLAPRTAWQLCRNDYLPAQLVRVLARGAISKLRSAFMLDTYVQSDAKVLAALKPISTPLARKVRNASRLGSQIKFFVSNTTNRRHATCRTAPKLGPQYEIYPSLPEFPYPCPQGYPQFPPSASQMLSPKLLPKRRGCRQNRRVPARPTRGRRKTPMGFEF